MREATLAQLVEHLTRNEKVRSSILRGGSRQISFGGFFHLQNGLDKLLSFCYSLDRFNTETREVWVDFNIKKVRNLQRCMRFFEYGIITLVVLYTSILGHILFFGKDGFEGINVFLFGIFFLCFLYRDLSETEDSSSLLINLNRWLFFSRSSLQRTNSYGKEYNKKLLWKKWFWSTVLFYRWWTGLL